MLVNLATDPGAWNIILWMIVLGVIGVVVLWALTTVLLRERPGEASDQPAPHLPSAHG